MSILLKLACLFAIGSSAGWIIELFFRRFYSKGNPERKWVNPGFLVGPWLPLYGFGLCVLYLLAGLEQYFAVDGWFVKAILFLIMAICMTAVEYLAGIVSIKLLKVHLWDYSEEWGNFQGIICPLFSFFWAILGAVYYFLIHPNILFILGWLTKNPTFFFVIGLYFGIFSVDVFYSCRIIAKIRSFAKENNVIVRYSRLRRIVSDTLEERKERRKAFFAIRSHYPRSEHFNNYLEWLRTNAEIVKEVIEDKRKK